MSVTLIPLALSDHDRVAHLAVHPDQLRFSGTVAEAFDSPQKGVDFHAMLMGDTPVGFFKIDRTYPAEHGFAEPGDLGLRAVIVDAARQGQGIGTAAMRALPGYLRALYPTARRLWLTVNLQTLPPSPVTARAVFRIPARSGHMDMQGRSTSCGLSCKTDRASSCCKYPGGSPQDGGQSPPYFNWLSLDPRRLIPPR